jgi:hypothetical protein
MQIQFNDILQVLTLVTLISGLIFGVLEIRRASKERSDKGALDVLSAIADQDHIQASYTILDLPEDAPPVLILDSAEVRRAANTLMV